VRSWIHARGTTRYKTTRTGHSYDLALWCDCIQAEFERHWHLLGQYRSEHEAFARMDFDQDARRLVAP
jgi:hypothetical protein